MVLKTLNKYLVFTAVYLVFTTAMDLDSNQINSIETGLKMLKLPSLSSFTKNCDDPSKYA